MNLVRMLIIGFSRNFERNNFNKYESICCDDIVLSAIFDASLLNRIQE